MKASINTNPVQRTKISNICTDTLARISWQGNSGIGLGSSGAPIFQDTTELIGVLQSVAYSSSNQCNFRAFNGEVLFANIAGQGSSFDKNIYTALQSYLDPLKKVGTQKTWPGASPAEFRYSDHVLKRGIYRSSMKDLYLKNLITNSQASVMAGKSITIQTSSGQTSTYKAGSSFFVNNIGISSTCYTTAIYKGSENESKEIYNPDMSHIRIDIMPNPFSNKTSISCSLSERSKVQLALYDILGNKVREIYNQEMPEGETRIEFRSDNLHPGIYLARMIIDGRPAITKRIVLQP
jgi:hypothetical protein